MALDGIFLHKLKNELSENIGSHIDKIHQPSKDELVFLLRSKQGAKRLLISAAVSATRINFTESKYENPDKPPMFCMLLRKYLGSARLCEVKQEGFERVLTLVFSSSNEMSDTIYPRLVCEMISSRPNIILCSEDGRIIDSLRHSNLESNDRIIQPGAIYTPPESQNKLNILNTETEIISKAVLEKSHLSLSKALLNTLDGFSPLVCNELSFRICGDIDMGVDQLSTAQRMNLLGQLNIIKNDINKNSSAFLLTNEKNEAKDFCFTEITHFGPSLKNNCLNSFSEALDAFFSKKEKALKIKRESEDILKLLSNLHSRTSKKLLLREKELESCLNREHLRIYGELLKANLYRLNNGMSSCQLENYYDESLSLINIPLDPALTPAANADRYFKEYKKSFNAERTLTQLIEEDKKDLLYYDSVLDALSRVEELFELKEIREELQNAGLIKSQTLKRPKKNDQEIHPREFEFNGFKILVGKNNRQNDFLTLSVADKEDIWLHTKNIPGSHVIILCCGKEPDEDTIIYAAELAAFYSKAQNGANVEVDFTKAKFVKKPSGSKPGMVIYSKNRTLYVNPRQE